jgi:5'-nucleotidase
LAQSGSSLNLQLRFLLTNDDGVRAPGLEALREAVRPFGEALVYAPHCERSGCSHAATTDKAFPVQELEPGYYAVEGTPADCVRVALFRHAGEIDYVIAGINNGGNLGVDVYLSGTVAAVREGVLHGVPGIAVSHYRNRLLYEGDWSRAIDYTRHVLEDLLARPQTPGVLWNVNLPCRAESNGSRPEVEFCPLDHSPLPLHFVEEDDTYRYRGRYQERQRVEGADIDVCFRGKIAVTPISLTGNQVP